ncbi:MAG: hypothetical protein IKU20_07565 [Lachnospiraceae bacterium]|nr:hypothetical protein [Lachnospiraceae bacterium]
MSDYRRLISYIYEYEGKEKGKSIGFVKLESRNDQCRLYVNAKRVYVGGNAIGVYLLGQGGEKTFLGNMFVRNGFGEFRTIVDVANVENSQKPLDTYYGLVVHDVKDSWRSYQTIWDDEMAAESENDSVTQPPPEEIQAAELEDPEVLSLLQETEQTAADPETRWQQLRKEYPKMQPFDYEGDSEVLAIRPDDIGKLPRENWIYGNNSFLLHGYYNYRYLLLIRLCQEQGQIRYLLGVPGHYYSNEKYMANMFGFPNFVLSKKQPPNDGRFGYWYTDIKLG